MIVELFTDEKCEDSYHRKFLAMTDTDGNSSAEVAPPMSFNTQDVQTLAQPPGLIGGHTVDRSKATKFVLFSYP